MAHQFIYTMQKVSRVHPPDKQVLENINLSFYPGAKIGVLGSNGAGKSSLLRIMAGEDDGYSGEARLTPGFSVGFLKQEPELDPDKDVAGNVADGVGEIMNLLTEFNEVCAAMGEPDADFDVLRHVNNAVYWEAVEELLARRRELRAPLRAELEHRAPIEPGADVEIVVDEGEGAAALWLRERSSGTLFATATVLALGPAPATADGHPAP